jgi:4-diphosphocytidyl-2-C-methyl-D-erythritol kinase
MNIKSLSLPMIRFPNCKINLGLHVTGKRSDGYHDLETIFYPVPMHDALEILESADGAFHFSMTGIPVPGDPGTNLCAKAFFMLHHEYNIQQVSMHLHKAIPTGSGLGGGSADGAFTLVMLNDLFNLGISKERLVDYAGRLGSDCPFFIDNLPSYATGRGDRLEPIEVDLHGYYLAILVPGVHVSTADAYRMVIPAKQAKSLKETANKPVTQWQNIMINDFEKPVAGKFPVISLIRLQLIEAGAIYVSMSGSGSAVYGLFREYPDIKPSGDRFTRIIKL